MRTSNTVSTEHKTLLEDLSYEKQKTNSIFLCLFVLIALFIAITVLFVLELYNNSWTVELSDVIRYGVLAISLGWSAVRLIVGGSGGGAALKRYEAIYRKQIGNAFPDLDQKRQRKALLRAIACYNENKFNGAITRLKALRKNCRSRADHNAVLLFLALTYSEAGMTDDAISTYEELVKISPSNSTAWSNLGLLYRQKGKLDRAVECLEKAVEKDEKNEFAWNNLAQAHLAECQWQKVIEPAERALSVKADMYQAETALTVAYYAMGEREKSKKYFDSAVLHGADSEKLTSILEGFTYGNITFGNLESISEAVMAAVGHLQRDTAIPMVEIRLPAPEDGNRSRLGGAPVEESVPTDSAGKPMRLLAAIWCSEVHGVPDFPSRGVLRFYVADNDLYSADFDHPAQQSDFRVLYDENEEGFDSNLRDDPEISEVFPIQHVLPVRLTPAMGSVRTSDYRFEDCANAALAKAGAENDMDSLSEDDAEFIMEQNAYAGHRIGGYPCFEQEDPRGYRTELRRYDTLLLQIVSHRSTREYRGARELIMFGDLGGCQFFIPSEKLRARDFSDVMFWWDCG